MNTKSQIFTKEVWFKNSKGVVYHSNVKLITILGDFLGQNHPASLLSVFSAPTFDDSDARAKGAYASLYAAKKLQERWVSWSL